MEQDGGDLPSDVYGAVVSRLEEAPVRLAFLFGSSVTGETTARSDIDIAIAYETGIDTMDTHLSLVADLTRILGRDDIDVVQLDSVDPRIATEAIEHGTRLVGSAEEASRLRDRLERRRTQRQQAVDARITETERTIERRLDQREHG